MSLRSSHSRVFVKYNGQRLGYLPKTTVTEITSNASASQASSHISKNSIRSSSLEVRRPSSYTVTVTEYADRHVSNTLEKYVGCCVDLVLVNGRCTDPRDYTDINLRTTIITNVYIPRPVQANIGTISNEGAALMTNTYTLISPNVVYLRNTPPTRVGTVIDGLTVRYNYANFTSLDPNDCVNCADLDFWSNTYVPFNPIDDGFDVTQVGRYGFVHDANTVTRLDVYGNGPDKRVDIRVDEEITQISSWNEHVVYAVYDSVEDKATLYKYDCELCKRETMELRTGTGRVETLEDNYDGSIMAVREDGSVLNIVEFQSGCETLEFVNNAHEDITKTGPNTYLMVRFMDIEVYDTSTQRLIEIPLISPTPFFVKYVGNCVTYFKAIQGLYRSIDGGYNWTQIAGRESGGRGINAHPLDPSSFINWGPGVLFRS